jgi:hypothetical protein
MKNVFRKNYKIQLWKYKLFTLFGWVSVIVKKYLTHHLEILLGIYFPVLLSQRNKYKGVHYSIACNWEFWK